MIPGLSELLDRLKGIHEKKAKDYTGTNPSPFYNFEVAQYLMSLFDREEDKVYACLIGIKIGRISTLRNSGQEPNNESLLDSFDDQILYTAFWRQMIENSSKKEEDFGELNKQCQNCGHSKILHTENIKKGILGPCQKGDGFGIPTCHCQQFVS